MPETLFVTGSSGFIGSKLLNRLKNHSYEPVYCLYRNPDHLEKRVGTNSHLKLVPGDLCDKESYTSYLTSSDTVIHLAAATGKAPREEYSQINANGTQVLIDECKKAGVKNFLYISTIAAKYKDKTRYYYAQSKEAGEEAVKLALRTQQVLAHESGLTETVDPMGGSYYLECLTDKIEADIEGYINRIAGYGENMLEAVINSLEEGFFHRELADAAYRQHLEVMDRSRVVVGVNKFEEEDEKINPTIFKADPAARERQTARLKKVRSERNNTQLQGALKGLAEAIKKEENLFPYILDAVKHYGTLGEIVGMMTDTYGRYQDLTIV